MKKYKKLISFSFRDYGDCAGVWDDIWAILEICKIWRQLANVWRLIC